MKSCQVILLFLTILLSACKKDDQAYLSGLVHTVEFTYGNAHFIETYSYDENRRVIRIDNSKGYFTGYTYHSDTVIVRYYSSTGNVSSTYIYKLNEYGAIDSGRSFTSNPGNDTYFKYLYNEEGYKIATKGYGPSLTLSETYDFTYADGNLISLTNNWSSGGNIVQIDMEYYMDKENKLDATFTGQNYLRKSDNNLLKHKITKFGADDPDPTIMISDYTYDYYSDGKIRVVTTNTIDQPITTQVYTYY